MKSTMFVLSLVALQILASLTHASIFDAHFGTPLHLTNWNPTNRLDARASFNQEPIFARNVASDLRPNFDSYFSAPPANLVNWNPAVNTHEITARSNPGWSKEPIFTAQNPTTLNTGFTNPASRTSQNFDSYFNTVPLNLLNWNPVNTNQRSPRFEPTSSNNGFTSQDFDLHFKDTPENLKDWNPTRRNGEEIVSRQARNWNQLGQRALFPDTSTETNNPSTRSNSGDNSNKNDKKYTNLQSDSTEKQASDAAPQAQTGQDSSNFDNYKTRTFDKIFTTPSKAKDNNWHPKKFNFNEQKSDFRKRLTFGRQRSTSQSDDKKHHKSRNDVKSLFSPKPHHFTTTSTTNDDTKFGMKKFDNFFETPSNLRENNWHSSGSSQQTSGSAKDFEQHSWPESTKNSGNTRQTNKSANKIIYREETITNTTTIKNGDVINSFTDVRTESSTARDGGDSPTIPPEAQNDKKTIDSGEYKNDRTAIKNQSSEEQIQQRSSFRPVTSYTQKNTSNNKKHSSSSSSEEELERENEIFNRAASFEQAKIPLNDGSGGSPIAARKAGGPPNFSIPPFLTPLPTITEQTLYGNVNIDALTAPYSLGDNTTETQDIVQLPDIFEVVNGSMNVYDHLFPDSNKVQDVTSNHVISTSTNQTNHIEVNNLDLHRHYKVVNVTTNYITNVQRVNQSHINNDIVNNNATEHQPFLYIVQSQTNLVNDNQTAEQLPVIEASNESAVELSPIFDAPIISKYNYAGEPVNATAS